MKSKRTGFKKRLALLSGIVMIAVLIPLAATAADSGSGIYILGLKDSTGVTATLNNPTPANVNASFVLAVYDPDGKLHYSKEYPVTVGANATVSQRFDYDVAAHTDCSYKLFAWNPLSFAPICSELSIGPPTVLFENGQWAPELGGITVHTPGGASTWAYEDGTIRLYNGVPVSRAIAFRWVFDNLVDMRGYDAVVMELDEPPSGLFTGILRFRIDQDAGWGSTSHSNIIRMTRGTSSSGGTGTSAGNWDLQRLRGVGALPAYGQIVRIKKIYLEGNGVFTPIAINARNIMDIMPPRTGNTPITYITTSGQYTGAVAWNPNHTTFQADTVYTATITLTPRPGWTLSGVAANWFRIYNRTGTDNASMQVTHAAGSGVLTRTFPATTPALPYPAPTQYVAFTFDDAPCADTNNLLDAIDELGIKVTFLSSGINLEKSKTNPDMKRAVDRMVSGGHQVASHAWQHERWGETNADLDIMKADFQRSLDVILELTGQSNQWIRQPYASISNSSLGVARELGLTTVRGVATDDWDIGNSASFLLNRVLTLTGTNLLRDGQIYTCHTQPGQTNSIQALTEIVHELRSRGYGFMTLSELRLHRNFPLTSNVTYLNFFNYITAPVITIDTQPTAPPAQNLIQGNISGSLTINASSSGGATPDYQWYSNTTASAAGGTAIVGATGAAFAVPTDLTAGTYYYYCVAGALGAANVTSNVVAVTITP